MRNVLRKLIDGINHGFSDHLGGRPEYKKRNIISANQIGSIFN